MRPCAGRPGRLVAHLHLGLHPEVPGARQAGAGGAGRPEPGLGNLDRKVNQGRWKNKTCEKFRSSEEGEAYLAKLVRFQLLARAARAEAVLRMWWRTAAAARMWCRMAATARTRCRTAVAAAAARAAPRMRCRMAKAPARTTCRAAATCTAASTW